MAAVAIDHLPHLGVGLGYRAPLRAGLFRQRERIGFLELIADHWLDPTPEQDEELDLLRRHFICIPHSLALSPGSAEGVDPIYVERLARLIERLDPPWWSDHLCFTRASGHDIGHLAPLPFSNEAVDVLARNIDEVRRTIATPLLLENIASTLLWPGAEMDEPAFVRAALDATGCGWLLDLSNLHANAINHGFDAHAALDRLPMERVVQIHLAGGHWRGEVLVDSHAWPTPDAVWDLLAAVGRRVDVRAVEIERNERLPPIDDLIGEMERACSVLVGG